MTQIQITLTVEEASQVLIALESRCVDLDRERRLLIDPHFSECLKRLSRCGSVRARIKAELLK